MVLYSTRFVQ